MAAIHESDIEPAILLSAPQQTLTSLSPSRFVGSRPN
jgi:hypothetical protein